MAVCLIARPHGTSKAKPSGVGSRGIRCRMLVVVPYSPRHIPPKPVTCLARTSCNLPPGTVPCAALLLRKIIPAQKTRLVVANKMGEMTTEENLKKFKQLIREAVEAAGA